MADSAQVAQNAYDAFQAGDIQAILAMLDEDVEWKVPDTLPHGGDFRGPEGAGQFFQGLAEKWEDLHVHIDHLVASGNHAVGIGHAHGRLQGVGEAGYGFAHLFTVDDAGKVKSFHEYVDAEAQRLAGIA